MAFAGLVGNRAAVAVRSARTDILPAETDHFDRLATAAFARICLAPLADAILSAPAKHPRGFFNCQYVHRGQLGTTVAFSRLLGDEIAGAVIFTVADIVKLVLVRRDNHSG
jgi:hypothetical protein